MKFVEEKNQKAFTKKESNNIIKKDYNPLKVNYKIYEREGLFMRETKDVLIKDIEKELNWREKIIVKLFPNTFVKVYGIAGKRAFNNIYKV